LLTRRLGEYYSSRIRDRSATGRTRRVIWPARFVCGASYAAVMTEEFDNELDNNVDEMVVEETIIETPVVPIESAPEGSLAAAANAIPALGAPIVVDPYSTQTYTAPTYAPAPSATTYHGGTQYSHHYPAAHPAANVTHPGHYAPYGYPAAPYGHTQVPMDGFAIAALACGVAGLVFLAPVIGSILGIVFGIIALNRVRQTGQRGHGLAVAGIVTGAIGLLFGLTALFGLLGLAASNWYYWM